VQKYHPHSTTITTPGEEHVPYHRRPVSSSRIAELRKAGLTHPLMDEIEKRFAAGG
jgi:hypothetical protein